LSESAVLIAGGGIGGLTTALCLARHGIPVRLFEQAEAFTEVGAGIQLSPNAVRVLQALDLESGLLQWSCRPQAVLIRHWRDGNTLARQSLGHSVADKFGAPYYHIHRADLIQLLSEKATGNPLITLEKKARVSRVTDHGDQVSIHVSQAEATGSALIGADGIHSQVRQAMGFPLERVFSGHLAWRGLIPAEQLPERLRQPSAGVWPGPGGHFVHYPVRGGQWVNCVAVTTCQGSWREESWEDSGDISELAHAFARWHPDIQHFITQMSPETCFKWALYTRKPQRPWSRGRVTLLGDACHPTLPYLAQGAAMAIEDAAVLSNCLAGSASEMDIPAQFRRYERLRYARCARIQRQSRFNGWLYHLPGPLAWIRNPLLMPGSRATMRWLYSYDALAVNAPGLHD